MVMTYVGIPKISATFVVTAASVCANVSDDCSRARPASQRRLRVLSVSAVARPTFTPAASKICRVLGRERIVRKLDGLTRD